MKTKLIGITPRLLTEDGTLKQFVNDKYVNAMALRGATAIMLTLDNENYEEIFALCDGFLVTGGGDIDPQYYGEDNTASKRIQPRLDTLDKKVIEYAYQNNVPLLGICRGHQDLNVFLGGSLYQHIDNHTDIDSGHEVITFKNRFFDFDENILTNSYHHQALKDIAPGFSVAAKHKDGTVEMIIHDTKPMFSVQWHPEGHPEWKESKMIFDKFFELVDEYKNNK